MNAIKITGETVEKVYYAYEDIMLSHAVFKVTNNQETAIRLTGQQLFCSINSVIQRIEIFHAYLLPDYEELIKDIKVMPSTVVRLEYTFPFIPLEQSLQSKIEIILKTDIAGEQYQASSPVHITVRHI